MEFLRGIKIYNYRSIDGEGIELDEFGKINVLIGKNNSGKSNILRFIAYLKQLTASNDVFKYNNPHDSELNIYNYNSNNKIHFDVALYPDSINKILRGIDNEEFKTQFINTQQKTWVPFTSEDNDYFSSKDLIHAHPFLPDNWIEINTDQARINVMDLFYRTIANGFRFNTIGTTDSYLIENYRKINDPTKPNVQGNSVEERSISINGHRFLSELEKIMRPAGPSFISRKKFRLFKAFLRSVLNNNNIEVSISYEGEIQLQLDNHTDIEFPIKNLGTGIHQLILLAFATTTIENSIFCIEEPEIFIHPEVQRKFIRYLVENTNNQYFITTHSNAFINEEGLDVYRVWHDGRSTKVEKAIDSNSKSQILDDLGYHASDLLQTNFIIWVEGPSDRIYIRHWINCEDKKLIEGIHYTIMFYGGRLLSHLTIDDSEIEDFINISNINRNAAIFIDSDKKDEKDNINHTKERIIKSFAVKKKQFVLTVGREIENYIEIKTLNRALVAIGKKPFAEYNRYTDIFEDQTIDKMKLAKAVIRITNNVFKTGGLKDDIQDLVYSIKKSNNLVV
jgi:predicted ATP-dependent endonuclease of OLD family